MVGTMGCAPMSDRLRVCDNCYYTKFPYLVLVVVVETTALELKVRYSTAELHQYKMQFLLSTKTWKWENQTPFIASITHLCFPPKHRTPMAINRWSPREDLNLHGFPLVSKTNVYANFATRRGNWWAEMESNHPSQWRAIYSRISSHLLYICP